MSIAQVGIIWPQMTAFTKIDILGKNDTKNELHRGSSLASHPAASGLILGVPENLFHCCQDLSTALLVGKWTED